MADFKNKYKPKPLYDPRSQTPFSISRSKIDLYLECPRCFYLDRRLGVSRPDMAAFTLNNAVDYLLKKEFDLLRVNGEAHELMKKYGIDAIPLKHPQLPIWRDDVRNFKGASVVHKETNLEVCGIVDDIWKNHEGKLLIVDYKATSTSREISLEDKWKQGYKRQIEVYQWIFRRMGFDVSDTGYFVFANAGKNRPKFDARLEFELTIVAHKGDNSWVEPTLHKIKKTLDSDQIPASGAECQHCAYREKINKVSL